MPVTLLESLQNKFPLIRSAHQVERNSPHSLPDLVVGCPISPLARQHHLNSLWQRFIARKLLNGIDKQPIELLCRHLNQMSADEEGLNVSQGLDEVRFRSISALDQIVRVHQ